MRENGNTDILSEDKYLFSTQEKVNQYVHRESKTDRHTHTQTHTYICTHRKCQNKWAWSLITFGISFFHDIGIDEEYRLMSTEA